MPTPSRQWQRCICMYVTSRNGALASQQTHASTGPAAQPACCCCCCCITSQSPSQWAKKKASQTSSWPPLARLLSFPSSRSKLARRRIFVTTITIYRCQSYMACPFRTWAFRFRPGSAQPWHTSAIDIDMQMIHSIPPANSHTWDSPASQPDTCKPLQKGTKRQL